MLRIREEKGLKALRGRFLNPQNDTQCDHLSDGLLVARDSGAGYLIEAFGETAEIAPLFGWRVDELPLNEGIILPPFYDTHFHWVQDDVREQPKVSLLEWLERYTFPEEARFADADFAEEKAKRFWNRILSVGTAGGLCYSSIHQTALDAAMRHAPSGFRIGNVQMTMHCPTFLQQSQEEAIESARYGSERYGDRYCITPRFAPTTHPNVMSASACIAQDRNLFQQTHLCETPAEIAWVLGIYKEIEGFEDVESYTEIYQRCGVLGPRTVMGHAIHLSESEWELLAQTDTAIASCPTSNAPVNDLGLGSGLFNFKQAGEYGVRWSLASDIGGGPFLSMFDVMDSFVRQNKDAGNSDANYAMALYRSTVAGAAILNKSETHGNFQPGKRFECIHCGLSGNDDRWTPESILQDIISQAKTREDFDSLVQTTVLDGAIAFSAGQSENQQTFERRPV